jgi:urate oxidase
LISREERVVKLIAHRYGKCRVRVLKILREGDVHTIRDLTARLLLEGDFDASFTAGDNRLVVATDTLKNMVNVLAHEHLGHEIEPFAIVLADHLRERYEHVSRVDVDLEERSWTRMTVGGAPHPHAFTQQDAARGFTRLVAGRGHERHESGVTGLTLLKSTGSGFADFHRDDLRTLADTTERILATSMRAVWTWTRPPASYTAANRSIVSAMLVPFAQRYSPSVQRTLFEMAEAALAASPEIGSITLTMPNLHCLPIDLQPFGRTNRHEVFVPTEEPHGYIEATVER